MSGVLPEMCRYFIYSRCEGSRRWNGFLPIWSGLGKRLTCFLGTFGHGGSVDHSTGSIGYLKSARPMVVMGY
ncbi:hypothetical protein BWR15_16280 [Pseudomonas sp. T]|nr:hypothetical protein BWR15_16280 [Pseudomonas sp. T]